MTDGYTLNTEVPSAEDYRRLRQVSGLTARSEVAAKAGLPHTVVGVVARHHGVAVGMGRAIGDGLFYQVVDIAVEPNHQGRGLGKAIVARLMAELRNIAPAEAYVSLIADGKASQLYTQFGFTPTAPVSIGMAQWINR